jgi:hypothetical protein
MAADSSGDRPERAATGPEFLDNPYAPDAFATDVSGFVLLGGNVGVTFETVKIDHATGRANRVVVARLLMPLEGAQRFSAALANFLQQKVAPAAAPTPAHAPAPSPEPVGSAGLFTEDQKIY